MNLLRAEWTKLRTVRGWMVGLALALLAIVGLGVLPSAEGTCGTGCGLPVGPGGEEVTDGFTFVHQPLTGDGSITVRVASLTGELPSFEGPPKAGVMPWSKAGLILKDGTRRGSTYAAVMVTGGHGARMQYDYTHDLAGRAGAAPRWLRLTRAGDRITGAESADGGTWTTIGTARLGGLPATVQVGLFVTSPQYAETSSETVGLIGASGGPTRATATFDHLDRQGTWTTTEVGRLGNVGPSEVRRDGDTFTVSGSGDIAPAVAGAAGLGTTITQTLVGTFVGLIFVVVVATLFVTTEYRRGLIRTTITASPRRGRVLATKAVVVAAVTFVLGLVAAAVVVTAGRAVLQGNGVYVHAVSTATELRVIVGTAALLAIAAVLALGLGALLRRSATAVTAAIVTIVLPYLLALTVLPGGAGQWLLRVTPAAAFALQQSTPRYAQVDNIYTPINGYFPLPPAGGLAVLGAWAALALGLAVFRLRREDV
jgi:hypothetical protein